MTARALDGRRRRARAEITSFVSGQLLETLVVLVLSTCVMHLLLTSVTWGGRPSDHGGRGHVVTTYVAWLWDACRFDFGESPYSHRSVTDMVRDAAPKTVGLLLLGLASTAGATLGASWWRAFGGAAGRWVTSAVASISLVPVYLLAFRLRAGPEGAFQRVDAGLTAPVWLALIATLAFLLTMSNGLFAESLSTLSGALKREASESYVLGHLARGVRPTRALIRNTSAIFAGSIGGQLPRLVTAVFILEWAFNIHGLGYEGLRAFDFEGRRDVPVIMATTFLTVLAVRVLMGLERFLVFRFNPRLGLER